MPSRAARRRAVVPTHSGSWSGAAGHQRVLAMMLDGLQSTIRAGSPGRYCGKYQCGKKGTAPRLEAVRRAPDTASPPVQHVSVDHRRVDVAVSQELLHRPDVVAVLDQ